MQESNYTWNAFLSPELLLVECCFLLDCILHFFTLYNRPGREQITIKTSVQEYASGWLGLDLVCLAPWYLLVPLDQKHLLLLHACVTVKFLRTLYIFRLHGSVKFLVLRAAEVLFSASSPVRKTGSSLGLLMLHSGTYFIMLGCLLVCLAQADGSFYDLFLDDTQFTVLSGATVGYESLGGNYGLVLFVMLFSIGFFGVFVGRVRKLMAHINHLAGIARGVDQSEIDHMRILAGRWGIYSRSPRHEKILQRIIQAHELHLWGHALMPNLNKIAEVTGKGYIFSQIIGAQFEEFSKLFSYLAKSIGLETLQKLYCEAELRVYPLADSQIPS